MNENKKIYLTAIVSKLSIVFLGIVTSALINRHLGVFLKGEYAYIINIVSILTILFSFGLSQTYSTYKRNYKEDLLGFFIFISLVQTGIIFFLALVSFVFQNITLTLLFMLTSGGILRTNILCFAAIEDIKKRDFNNIFYKIFYLIIVVIAYCFLPKSLEVMLLVTFIDEVIMIIGTFISFRFVPRFKGIDRLRLKTLFKLCFFCMMMHFLMNLNYNLDVLFLKSMTSSDLVGLYSVGTSLANMLWLIPDAFKDILIHKTTRRDSVQEIVLVIKYSIYMSFIFIIGFVLLGKLFINVMYGLEFSNSYFCTIILFVGCLSMIIYKLIHPIYISKGKQSVVVKILFLSVLINIVLNLFLIPYFTIYGAAIASVFSYTTCSFIFLKIFCKEYNINFYEFFIIRKKEIKRILKKTSNF